MAPLTNTNRSEAFFVPSQYVRQLSTTTDSSNFTKDPKKYEGISGTLSELVKKLGKDMGMDHVFRSESSDLSYLQKYMAKSQSELPARSMNDSYIAAIIPLSTDEGLQEKYTTFLGTVRVGRLLEDMDIFAVIVCHKHIVNPNLPKGEIFPQRIVTVLVDRIDLVKDRTVKNSMDIKISGHVSWAGKSTLEVVVWLEQYEDGRWKRVTRALFLMAARDPTFVKSAIVNPISPANDRERTILEGGEDRKKRRMVIETSHVSKALPNPEEQKLIHDIYLRTGDSNDLSLAKRILPQGAIWMSDSKLSNVIFSQPESRNFNNTIFGGFIMRQALELAWVLGYIHSKERPKTISISDIRFKSPVPVNALIQMHASMVYTFKNFMQVLVFVEVLDPKTGKADTTNTLHFTFRAPSDVKEVLPFGYYQFMMYIDGRRHFLNLENKLSLTGLASSLSDFDYGFPIIKAKL